MGVKDYPVDFGSETLNKQIVYSPHDYGPIVYKQPWFEKEFTFESLKKDAWDPYWLYITDEGIAPILVGEWGGFMQGDNLKWMNYMRQLIDEKKLNHTFWCFNANSGDTGGLVKDDFKTWDEEKYGLVKKVLWQNDSGKFVGLDHKVPLGANGISLSEFSGKIVTVAPESEKPSETTADNTSETQETTAVETTAESKPAEKSPASNVRRIVVAVIIVLAGVGVCAFAVLAGVRAAASKTETTDGKEDVPLGDSKDTDDRT